MPEPVYVLKVAKGMEKGLKDTLRMKTAPSHVRLATVAPLSNFGFPAGAEGTLLWSDGHGYLIGVEDGDTPRLYVPMQNVAYIADAAGLAAGK